MPVSSDLFNEKVAGCRLPRAIRKQGAKKFSFTSAELSDTYAFRSPGSDGYSVSSMDCESCHLSEESFDRQYQVYKSYSDSDDLDNLVLYNTVGQFCPRSAAASTFANRKSGSHGQTSGQEDVSPVALGTDQCRRAYNDDGNLSGERQASFSQNLSQSSQNKSLEEESQRPEVMALINKYMPFSYSNGGMKKSHRQVLMTPGSNGQGRDCSIAHQSCFADKQRGNSVGWVLTKKPDITKTDTRNTDRQLLPKSGYDSPSASHDWSKKPSYTQLHAASSDLEIDQRRSLQKDYSQSWQQTKLDHGLQDQTRTESRKNEDLMTFGSADGSHSDEYPCQAASGKPNVSKLLLQTGQKQSVRHHQAREDDWNPSLIWQSSPRSVDDFSGTAPSDSSDRSSRIDPQVYQSYAAGLLHSSYRSNKFLRLQKYYSMLERIAAIEGKTLAKNALSGKGRFNLVNIRSKSLGSLAPQSKSDNILLSKYDVSNIWELKELYADLEEAQDDEQFLFDAGHVEEFQWNPWEDWGIQNKKLSTQQLQLMFERGLNQNTQASLSKLYRGTDVDFRREMSFRKLYEKYKHLDEETRRQKIMDEWGWRRHHSRRSSESSSLYSYGSSLTGTYLDLMEKAAQRARQRALYGYHIPEEYNSYEKHVQRMKKLTRSCPDINRLLTEKGRRSTNREPSSLIGCGSAEKNEECPTSRTAPRSFPKHGSTINSGRSERPKDDSGCAVRTQIRTKMGDLLRKELGEVTGQVPDTENRIRSWKETTPPWRSQRSRNLSVAKSAEKCQDVKRMEHTSDKCTEKVDSGLNMSWDDSFESEGRHSSSKRTSTTPLHAKSAWRSEVRGVVGAPMRSMSAAEIGQESLDRKLENFRQKHGWRKDSKPDPGTVSKALHVFKAMEEEQITPQHQEPLVGDGNPSLARRRKEAQAEALRERSQLMPSDEEDFVSVSHHQFKRSKSLSAKHERSLRGTSPSAKGQLQSCKSEFELYGKFGRKSDAFLQAKNRFEEMALGNEPVCCPKTGLPSRSQRTALGRYEARIRGGSGVRDGQARSRSFEDVSNKSIEYDRFQEELRKHSHNTDELSTASWKSKETSLEKHIRSRLDRKTKGSTESSKQFCDVQRGRDSPDWDEPQSPSDGRVSRLEKRDDDDISGSDPDTTMVKRQLGSANTSQHDHPNFQAQNKKDLILVRSPRNKGQSVSANVFETDLDTSRSQLFLKQGNEVDGGHLDQTGKRNQYGSGPKCVQNVFLTDHVKTSESPDRQQSGGDRTKMAIITPSTFGDDKPVVQVEPTSSTKHDASSADVYIGHGVKPSQRCHSTSVLNTGDVEAGPGYGDLSKWCRVNVTDGLEGDVDGWAQLRKWGPSSPNITTMSSNETFIIKDSDQEMSPGECSRSFSGCLPSQHEGSERGPCDDYPERADTASSDLGHGKPEGGSQMDGTNRQQGKDNLQGVVKPVGIPFRRNVNKSFDFNEDPMCYTWKREFDVPPNMDVDDVRNGGTKKNSKLYRSLAVVRNFTKEAGPQDFYNDLERLGKEWKRDADKKQTRQSCTSLPHQHGREERMDGIPRPLPEYRAPPCYVHPWLEQQTECRPNRHSTGVCQKPDCGTPFPRQTESLLSKEQTAECVLSQSKSCPEGLLNDRQGHKSSQAYHTLPLAEAQFQSSQQVCCLPLAGSHGMQNQMEKHDDDMNPTNQSEHAHATTQRNEPRQRHSLSGTGHSPTGSWDSRRRRDEEAARRKQEMKRITAQEKLKRMEEERRANEARRHNDFLTEYIKDKLDDKYWLKLAGIEREDASSPSQKSPIPLNRYDDVPDISDLQRPKKKVGAQYRGKARALYNFKAQNSKELSFKKNDIIYLLRQIDKNWYEGEHHGLVGIFPVNYVEVLMSLDEARQAAILREGHAKAKYNFTAQSSMEVSFKKGDTVSLIRRIDNNWFEGRVDGRYGIFPVSYVEVLREPDTPLPTPMSSYAPTPATGSPGQLSPVSTISNGPAPTIPSAPISPRSSVDNFDFGQPFSFSHYPSSSASLQRPSKREPAYADYGLESANVMRPASALGGLTDGYSTVPRDRSHPASRPNSAVPFSDYLKSSARDPGFYGSEESRYSRQKHREEELMRSLSNPYEGRQTSVGSQSRDSFSRGEEPRYPPYQALYSYKPQNPDELELREGDIVYVMEKCDDDWYVGTSQRTKEFGTFPGNYVRPL